MYLIDFYFRTVRKHPDKIRFGKWTRHIAWHYLKKLGRVDTGPVQRVLINLHDGKSEKYENSVMSDITSNTWHFNFGAFWKADLEKRRKMVVDRIQASLEEVGKWHRWNLAPFKKAHREVIKAGYVYEETGGKRVKSPDGQKIARWHYRFNEKRIDYYALVENKTTKKTRLIKFFHTDPYEMYIRGTLGDLKWLSNTKLALFAKAKDGGRQGTVVVK